MAGGISPRRWRGEAMKKLISSFLFSVVVATGGLAPLVVDSCRTIGEREPDLTVQGLRLAFERQQASVHHPATRKMASP